MFDLMEAENGMCLPQTNSGLYIPEAIDCMRCGMCVNTCPTFRLFEIEAETPRSRIGSIRNLLSENQPLGSEAHVHLNNCLQCRACEPVCPSQMQYAQLFDRAQAKLASAKPWLAFLGFWLIQQKSWRNRFLPFVSLYLKSGLQNPLRRTGLLKVLGLAEAEALLGQPTLKPLDEFYPAQTIVKGRVALFTGCIAERFDRDTQLAAIKLLNTIGYDVLVPPQQSCCGAIHQHNGQNAAELIANNLQVFNALAIDAILYTATGCGVMLSEYLRDESAESRQFCSRLTDINSFLVQHWPSHLSLLSTWVKVSVHEPCSQRNVLQTQQAVYDLLGKIPGLKLAPLADNQLCCGAGGSYMLTHPENADRLRQLKYQVIQQAESDFVVSSNFGCAVFLNGASNKVIHPLVLLAQHLPDKTQA